MPEEIKALELVEKFFRDEMTAEEQQSFHAQRAADAAFDQMVVTHLMFLPIWNNTVIAKIFSQICNLFMINCCNKVKLPHPQDRGK